MLGEALFLKCMYLMVLVHVLDNCSIHRVDEELELLRSTGIFVMFLPPYNPDYNPAEEAFSYVKYYLK